MKLNMRIDKDKLWFTAITNYSDVDHEGAASFVQMMRAQNGETPLLEQNDWFIRVNTYVPSYQIIGHTVWAKSYGPYCMGIHFC